ncbi:hypothetical protein SeMB42_g04628 [Synchytrium endobioticum]|uniref:Uncharacterized protein n=1 Tax=Synchytrium endobioticum TaxID=286115 RepID=A0A507CX55_9FUNG|nr:hypothetical protein SeMB42_g04628 [Synchytrium endobioticum]TPX47914.1 hypothetical protein SeLEV6574_g02373 [Synchytrium endobioticum]
MSRPTRQLQRPSASTAPSSAPASRITLASHHDHSSNLHPSSTSYESRIERPTEARKLVRQVKTLPANSLPARTSSYDRDRSTPAETMPSASFAYRQRSNSLPVTDSLFKVGPVVDEIRVKVYMEEAKRHRQSDTAPVVFSFSVELGISYREFSNKLRHKARTIQREEDDNLYGTIPVLIADEHGPLKDDRSLDSLIRKCWAKERTPKIRWII